MAGVWKLARAYPGPNPWWGLAVTDVCRDCNLVFKNSMEDIWWYSEGTHLWLCVPCAKKRGVCW